MAKYLDDDLARMRSNNGRYFKDDGNVINIAELIEQNETNTSNIYNQVQDIKILRNINKISGVIPITIFAWSDTISTARQTVWRASATQAQYIPKYTANICTIVSDNAQDNPIGTGLATVKVSGIDNDYNAIQEVVTLNGLTPVTLTKQYLAVNELNPETAGSTSTTYSAAGNIDVLYTDGDILARIPVSDPCPFNISYQAVFTNPAGLTFKINKFSGGSGSGDEIVINLFVINPINKIPVVQETLLVVGGESSPLDGTSITVAEKHTVIVCARATIGNNKNVAISIAGDLLVNSIMGEVSEYKL